MASLLPGRQVEGVDMTGDRDTNPSSSSAALCSDTEINGTGSCPSGAAPNVFREAVYAFPVKNTTTTTRGADKVICRTHGTTM